MRLEKYPIHPLKGFVMKDVTALSAKHITHLGYLKVLFAVVLIRFI